ncbi:MAG TPA: hypothetical protein VNU01_10770 [Egibacteraceae bacterium]|nr:hypothetical protein [Egibacteraceae bacterium]
MPGPDSDLGHDLVAHLYAAALRLMHEHQQAFLPLNKVQEQLGWDDESLGRVVDHCVRERPAITLPGAPSALTADWMDDGDRPAYGRSGVRFIGIRPAAPG